MSARGEAQPQGRLYNGGQRPAFGTCFEGQSEAARDCAKQHAVDFMQKARADERSCAEGSRGGGLPYC